MLAPASIFSAESSDNIVDQSSLPNFLESKIPHVPEEPKSSKRSGTDVGGKVITEDGVYIRLRADANDHGDDGVQPDIPQSRNICENQPKSNVPAHSEKGHKRCTDPVASTSGIRTNSHTPGNMSDESFDEDDEEPCCLCQKHSP